MYSSIRISYKQWMLSGEKISMGIIKCIIVIIYLLLLLLFFCTGSKESFTKDWKSLMMNKNMRVYSTY